MDNLIKARSTVLADFPYHAEFGKMLGDGRFVEQFLSKRGLSKTGLSKPGLGQGK
ncbi:MAG: hypothetical protein N4A61_12610 [Pelagimonas sp.]|nr:hypothetical protein [Pelagimonas sp.]